MKEMIREHADRGAAVIVSSHLLSLLEDLASTVLIIHRGHRLVWSSLEELRDQAEHGDRVETLEELFLRLTEAASLEGAAPIAATEGEP